MKRASRLAGPALALGVILAPGCGAAQQADSFTLELPDGFLSLRLPNGGAKALLSPTGWGAAFNSVFVGAGYQRPVPFADDHDGVVAAGIGLLDPVKYLGVEATITIVDVAKLSPVIVDAKVHRYLGLGTSIAFGVEGLFENLEDDAGNLLDQDPTYYGVVSHTLQGIPGEAPGTGRVNVSVGIGNGRFAEKPLRAQAAGKGIDGTYLFGNMAVELFRNFNVIGEWDGIGLNAGIAWALPLSSVSAAVSLGLADLTSESSEEPRLVVGGGIGFRVF